MDEKSICLFGTNKLTGKYRNKKGVIEFKDITKYEFENCINITNQKFYNEFNAKQEFIRDIFNNEYVVLQCKKYHSILLFKKDDLDNCSVVKYNQNVCSDDLTAVITNISFSQRSF